MTVKFNTKTSLIDQNFKADTVDSSSAAAAATAETDEVDALLEDMSGYEITSSSHVATAFDEYMVGDMDDESLDAAAQAEQFVQSVPTLDELVQANSKVLNHLELVIDHYESTEQKLKDYVDYLTDMMYTGQFDERETAQATKTIKNANTMIAVCEKGKQDASVKQDGLEALWRKEFREGDVNADGWIGKPYADGSLGVQTLDSGQKIYINPTTGVAYDHPPYADTEYQAVIGRGYDIIDTEAEDYTPPLGYDDEGDPLAGPTADLEICASDLNALEDSAFGTSTELYGAQYMWVKADSEDSFEPELAFQPGTTDSDTDTEPHYKVADFVMQDGQIVQETPEDMTKYIQVEIGSVEAYSKEVDGGKGYVHYIEYRSADESNTLVARICIRETKTDSWIPAACSELYASLPDNFYAVDPEGVDGELELTAEEQVEILNEKMADLGLGSVTVDEWSAMSYTEQKNFLMQQGSSKVYASSVPLAFNTDKIYSYGMKLDFSGIKSTARLTASLEQVEEALGLTRPDPSDEKAYRAYMENLSVFTDTSQMWAFHANNYRSGDHLKGSNKKYDWSDDYTWVEIERNFDSGGYASVYIDPESAEAQAQVFNHRCTPDFVNVVNADDHWDDGERPVTETQSTQITGVLVYGSGRPGHVVGTEYNDAVHVAEKNAKYDELKEKFPWAEPIMPESAFNDTVIENVEVVRGYDANHYITGVNLAVIDGDTTSDNFIEAKSISQPTAETLRTEKLTSRSYNAGKCNYDKHNYDEVEYDTLDVNFKQYIHVDAGGTVAIDNPDETDTNELIDSEWKTGDDHNDATEYYNDDYYDIVSSTDTRFGNITDQDAIEAVPSGDIHELGDIGDIGTQAGERATEIEKERNKTEVPDYLEAAAEEWMTKYGGAMEETKTEMDDFFSTAFGDADSLFAELEAEESDQVIGSPTTSDYIS